MTSFTNSPRLVQGGIVLADSKSARVLQVVALQYNPDTITRSLQAQGAGADSGDRLEPLRLKGAPIETIKLEAELDAIDQLEHPDANPQVAALGLHQQLAALEAIIYPKADAVQSNLSLASAGTLEINPIEAPLTLFVWSARRVVPVRITELSITEEAFDANLNPIRARVSLGLRVLNTNDFPVGHRANGIFFAHHRAKEQLAGGVRGDLAQLGIRSIT